MAAASFATALVFGCARQTIGLGHNPPDAAPTSTVMETPTSRPDAAAPKQMPSASPTHAPSTQPPPYTPPKFPTTRPAHYDAGTHLPSTTDHDVTEADAGHGCRGLPGDCGANAPYCDPLTGRCVNCLGDFHCGLGTHCDQTTQECVCSSDSECRYTGRCDTLTRQCLWPCSQSGMCAPISPICDISRSVCVQCLSNTECAGKTIGNIPTPLCHRGLCVQCADDTQCSSTPSKHFCQLRGNICVECLRSADCPDKAECLGGICYPPPGSPATSPSGVPSGLPSPSPSGTAP